MGEGISPGSGDGSNRKQKAVSDAGIVYICVTAAVTIAAILCVDLIEQLSFAKLDRGITVAYFIGALSMIFGVIMLYRLLVVMKQPSNMCADKVLHTGVYAWVRHPLYSAVLLISSGMLILTGNYLAFLLPMLYWLYMTLLMRETDERVYRERFGIAYEKYCRRVNRCLPWFPDTSDELKSEYHKSVRKAVVGVMVSVLLVILFSQAITSVSARMTYGTALEMKKSMLKENVDNMISYLDACVDDLTLEPGMTQEVLEEKIVEIAHRKIYSETHVDGTYMWVQKVLDFNGGDDYAIRLIHPNLSGTEGSYLSTNTVNEMGMKAYEEELEGVKANGAVYLNYAFKKLDSDEVTEKVTYSRLYDRFGWIVCMGVNIDDLYHYRRQAQASFGVYQTIILVATAITWVGFFLIMSYSYRKSKIGVYEKKNRELSDKLNKDALTGAGSRLFGEKALSDAFNDYQSGSEYMLLLIMDVDFFKQFNDNYGHDVGDMVLKEFVTAVKSAIRKDDSVIRWGGDEFIVVLNNVAPKYQPEVADKILNAVRGIQIPELEGRRKITASMGFAYFDPSDEDAKSALARADEALYRAKEAGRNNWKI
ncbi:MAG: diguanylate cyclase [Lachnospiraceae bacterium]|nr:diguanylate cyclase [Lachnospiraceae bacterium]MBO4558818.1 diguanylate cyclase [Lachnospiraceae bacterium]